MYEVEDRRGTEEEEEEEGEGGGVEGTGGGESIVEKVSAAKESTE